MYALSKAAPSFFLRSSSSAWCFASSFSIGGVSLASATAVLNFSPAAVWSVTISLANALILSDLVLVSASLLLSISNRLATAVLVRNVDVTGTLVAGAAAVSGGGSAANETGAIARKGSAAATIQTGRSMENLLMT